MTKIESRALDLDELPPWDDAEEPTAGTSPPSGERELAAYTLDSEQRTLVGLGPLERARRSRAAAAAAAAAASVSGGSPLIPSEPPGPFIADDDAEPPPSFRGRKLGKRTLAVAAALLVPLAAVGLVRGLSSSEAPPSTPPRAAASPPLPLKPTAPAPPSEAAPSEERRADAPGPGVDETSLAERAKDRARGNPAAERPSAELAPPPVKLAEVPPTPAVVDRASGSANAGTLNVISTPPASVVLDGRPVGKSPRAVRVPAGSHTVVFIHPLYGRRTVSVNVRPGATAAAATEF